MGFAIAGIVTAVLSTIVGLIGSFRSKLLLADSELGCRDFHSALDQHVKRKQELYDHLTSKELFESTSIAKFPECGC